MNSIPTNVLDSVSIYSFDKNLPHVEACDQTGIDYTWCQPSSRSSWVGIKVEGILGGHCYLLSP